MAATGTEITVFDRKMIEDGNYWINKLGSGEIKPSNLRLDFQRPAAFSPREDYIEVELSGQPYEKLKRFTGNGSFLLYTTLLAALKICLYKYTGNTTIVVGGPIRKHDDASDATNVLAIADDVDDRMSFRQLLMNVRQTLLEAYERQRYPFNRLVRDLKLEAAENRCSLFDVTMELANIHGKLPVLKNDISIAWSGKAEKLSGRFEFNGGLFKRETIERFANHMINLLCAALDNKDAVVGDLDMVTPAERHRLLIQFNDTDFEFKQGNLIHGLFERQVERTPDNTAVIFEGDQVTFAELNARANQMAHFLRSLGVGPEVPVGICVERSMEMVIGLLAILKAGGAYVPLDSEYPQQRLAFLMKDLSVGIVLTQQRLAHLLSETQCKVICLDGGRAMFEGESEQNPDCEVTGDNLAYIIYTSGSTGQAKGVMIPHRGICNRLLWMVEAFSPDEAECVLQKTTFSFDASVWEFFLPLITGARLVVARPGLHGDTAYLVEAIRENRVTIVQLVPSMLQVLVEEPDLERCETLLRIFCGGEALPSRLQQRVAQRLNAVLYNLYGPTEVSIDATYWKCEGKTDEPIVPIGRPLPNVHVYVLDSNLNPVPTGVPGELYIAGAGLARGYFDRPDLTADRFVPSPFGEQMGTRLYRTGDLVRHTDEGCLEFLGRVDHQVKIRGYRIELGEIEASIMQHHGVREAAVLVREYAGGDKRLVAYFDTVEGNSVSVIELRSFVAERLPDYMVPSLFVALERLPLTVSGKLDRKALPLVEAGGPEQGHILAPPRGPIDEVLVGIWSQVLGKDEISIYDNFFDLGGHSLLATQVVSRVRKAFNIELPLRRLFESPTVAALASWVEWAIRMEETLEAPPVESVPRDRDLPLSFAQQRLWFLDQLASDKSIYNGPIAIRLTGALNTEALRKTLNGIVNRHDVLRTTFVAVSGRPVQVIGPPQEVNLPATDLTALAEAEREARALEVLNMESRKPFDLANEPPWRVMLLRMGEQDHIVLFVMHHIISDAWSTGILVREIATSYKSLSIGEEPSLPAMPIQYADYAAWQRNWLQPAVIEKLVRYWKGQLKHAPELLNLPTDHPRPRVQSYQGATKLFDLGADLSNKLNSLSRRHGVTLFMTLLAGFQALLHRYSGQDNIAVGSPIANRNRAETEELIGCLINTLVLDTDLSGNPTYTELLTRVREVCLGAYAHQDLPFELLVEAMQPERRSNYTPIFQVWFVLQNAPMEGLQLNELTLSEVVITTERAQFDLVMSLVETSAGIHGALTYNTDLFVEGTIQEMIGHYRQMLEAGAGDEELGILDVMLLGDGKRYEGSKTSAAFSDEFEDQFVISALALDSADPRS